MLSALSTVSQPPKTCRLELSGIAWVSRFSATGSTEDLSSDFKNSVNSFLTAIKNAGGTYGITITRITDLEAYGVFHKVANDYVHWSTTGH